MPIARIVTRSPEDAVDVANRLQSYGYTVEILSPEEAGAEPRELDLRLERCWSVDAVARAAELADGNPIFVAAGALPEAPIAQPAAEPFEEPATIEGIQNADRDVAETEPVPEDAPFGEPPAVITAVTSPVDETQEIPILEAEPVFENATAGEPKSKLLADLMVAAKATAQGAGERLREAGQRVGEAGRAIPPVVMPVAKRLGDGLRAIPPAVAPVARKVHLRISEYARAAEERRGERRAAFELARQEREKQRVAIREQRERERQLALARAAAAELAARSAPAPKPAAAVARPERDHVRTPMRRRDRDWRSAFALAGGIAVGLTFGWLLLAGPRPANPVPLKSLIQGPTINEQTPFGPATAVPAANSTVQRPSRTVAPAVPAAKSSAAPKVSQRPVRHSRSRDNGAADDVTVRYFTHTPPRAAVTTQDGIKHISDQ